MAPQAWYYTTPLVWHQYDSAEALTLEKEEDSVSHGREVWKVSSAIHQRNQDKFAVCVLAVPLLRSCKSLQSVTPFLEIPTLSDRLAQDHKY